MTKIIGLEPLKNYNTPSSSPAMVYFVGELWMRSLVTQSELQIYSLEGVSYDQCLALGLAELKPN